MQILISLIYLGLNSIDILINFFQKHTHKHSWFSYWFFRGAIVDQVALEEKTDARVDHGVQYTELNLLRENEGKKRIMGILGKKSQNPERTEIGGTDIVHHQRGQS